MTNLNNAAVYEGKGGDALRKAILVLAGSGFYITWVSGTDIKEWFGKEIVEALGEEPDPSLYNGLASDTIAAMHEQTYGEAEFQVEMFLEEVRLEAK